MEKKMAGDWVNRPIKFLFGDFVSVQEVMISHPALFDASDL